MGDPQALVELADQNIVYWLENWKRSDRAGAAGDAIERASQWATIALALRARASANQGE